MANTAFTLPSINRQEQTVYPVSPMFDVNKGDFVVDKSGDIKMSQPEDAFKIWCYKAINVERFNKTAYSAGFGIETPPLDLYIENGAKESWLKRTITESIMGDALQRASEVTDFKFNYFEPDSVEITFTVILKNGNSFEMIKELEV